MKREVKCLVLIFVLILTISLISADFNVGKPNSSIETVYAPGDFIRGWVNLSLSNELSSSLFETGDGDSMTLMNLILKNPGFQYSCSPSDCSVGYSIVSSSGATTKETTFTPSDTGEIFGFEVSGASFENVLGFFMDISSDAIETDAPQLSIDLLNDGVIDWQSYVPSTTLGNKDYGCYVAPATAQTANIAQNLYCEKIHVEVSPNLTIGAEVIANTGGEETFTLSIDDKEGEYGSCTVITSSAGTIRCSPAGGSFPRVNEEKDYYVCIKTNNNNNKYKINYEKTSPCGYVGTDTTWDFQIFTQSYKYAALSSFRLNNTETKKYSGSSTGIQSLMSDYIFEAYSNNCTSGCIIPINVSGVEQTIGLSGELSYSAGISTTENLIYGLQESNARISTSKYQKLSLDNANFVVPESFGDYRFFLKLNNRNIFSKNVSVERIPRIVSLYPNIVMAAYPATFAVETETFSRRINITRYQWTFDDGVVNTTEGIITHTFPTVGTYNLTIKVTDTRNATASRKFSIIAEVPITAINLDLAEKNESLKQLNSYLNNLTAFYKNSLNGVLNITGLNKQLADIEARNKAAVSDANYVAIMNDLMMINIPKNISTSRKADSFPFFAKPEKVNVDALKEISSGKTSGSEGDYQDAVVAWNNENIDMKVDFEEVSANYDEEDTPLIRFFKVTITKKQDLDYNPYFFIPQMDDLKYSQNYSKTVADGYDYIKLTQDETIIILSTSEEFDFVTLPAFVSPEISELSSFNINILGEQKNNRIIIAIIAAAALIVIGVVVYLFMRKWYQNKYEDYLFKNKNDLYNLVSYIQTARKNGISESEILARLKKSKWKAEQIKYVMKKSR